MRSHVTESFELNRAAQNRNLKFPFLSLPVFAATIFLLTRNSALERRNRRDKIMFSLSFEL